MSGLQNILHPIFPRASEFRLNLFKINGFIHVTNLNFTCIDCYQISDPLLHCDKEGRGKPTYCLDLLVLIYSILFISGRVLSKRPFLGLASLKVLP